jgi:hypothetical protein
MFQPRAFVPLLIHQCVVESAGGESDKSTNNKRKEKVPSSVLDVHVMVMNENQFENDTCLVPVTIVFRVSQKKEVLPFFQATLSDPIGLPVHERRPIHLL